ncbi:hypothetical protein C9J03_26150 [Photobacterium gaetbulicola]|uniref:hypothetical protein n=1 Tax=Photobacterium gaetbulicola TaxID=1295392 RepID=UPI000D17290D|nr:hypothetical protein [Photobacterium gaetbulicola]PST98657.1 hypothetical protein C9J03_26150 [Photobacterium gaetbulicola]
MAFESLHEIAKAARSGSSRGGSTTKSIISITQAYYQNRDARVITIRLSEKALSEARMQVGDRVDVAYDRENKLWRVALISDLSVKGYAISGTANSARGQVRFTHYEPMPLIAPKYTRKANAFSIDEDIQFSPGQIIFSINEDTIKIDSKEAEAVEA